MNGMILGAVGGTLPSIRERIGIDEGGIAVLLFSMGVAAVISMQFGGRFADAKGARLSTLGAMPVMAGGGLVLAAATSMPLAIIGVVIIGLGNGTMDVSMNALGVQVEAARRRPIMSFFHAFFSVGNFAGAGSVLLLSAILNDTGAAIVAPVLLTVSIVALMLLVAVITIVPYAEPVPHTHDGKRTQIPKLAWLLGLMALAFGLSEGTAVDWSSVHVTDVANVDSSTGALGLVAVSGFMVLIRLFGDKAVARFGRRTVVRFGGSTAVIGYLMVALVEPLPLLLVGWALVGFGVGMIAPQVYAVAGHIGGGRILAVVVTFGYAAFLIGPALIGSLTRAVGIQHAMFLPLLMCALIVSLAAVMPRIDQDLL